MTQTEDQKIKARERSRLWRLNNPNYNKIYNKQYYQDNKELLKEKVKKYTNNNKDKISKMNKEYRLKNIEKLLEYERLYRLDNPDRNKIYYQNNIESEKQRSLEYRNLHLEQQRASCRKWCKEHPTIIRLHAKNTRARRKCWGNIQPINKYFESSDFHHMHIDGNKGVGIYIPTKLHKSICHRWDNQDSMDKINKAAIHWSIEYEI